MRAKRLAPDNTWQFRARKTPSQRRCGIKSSLLIVFIMGELSDNGRIDDSFTADNAKDSYQQKKAESSREIVPRISVIIASTAIARHPNNFIHLKPSK
jgi:hypothetical protein